jgi:hypothetical protein
MYNKYSKYGQNKSTACPSEYQKIIRTVICMSYISNGLYLMLETILKLSKLAVNTT